MSDRSDAIDVRDLRPGMRIEIVQRPWTGTVVSIKGPGGLFTALRDGDAHSTGEETAWSPSVIDRIRLGKKAAGRVLDGVTHDAYPEVFA